MPNVKAKIILEVAGNPKDHVEKTLNKVVEQIPQEEGCNLDSKEIFPVEEKDDLYSGFAETQVSFEGLDKLYSFCFKYLPSSVDVLEPEEMKIQIGEFNQGINDLLSVLHDQDKFLKNSNAQNKVLQKNLNQLLSNFLTFLLEKPKSSKEVAQYTGVPEEKVKKQLDDLVKNGQIKQEGEKYVKNG